MLTLASTRADFSRMVTSAPASAAAMAAKKPAAPPPTTMILRELTRGELQNSRRVRRKFTSSVAHSAPAPQALQRKKPAPLRGQIQGTRPKPGDHRQSHRFR